MDKLRNPVPTPAIALAALICATLALPATAQQREAASDGALTVAPRAIAGAASSARHCLSGDAVNVHSLGWAEAGTTYTITFESDVALTTVATRLNLDEQNSRVAFGNPDISSTSSTSGTMALQVAANDGQAGCYRYKVEIESAPRVIAARAETISHRGELASVDQEPTFGPTAITGLASSAQHCVGGRYVANVHEVGKVDAESRVSITFDASFDAIAGVQLVAVNADRDPGEYLVDDDSGGNLNPALNFTVPAGRSIVLFVAGVNGATGCYRYKVEIR
jgi:hypothetical protein